MSEQPGSAGREVGGTAFVARHAGAARQLGEQLAELVTQPDEFVALLREGLRGLVDPASAATLAIVSPGITPEHTVRRPLLELVVKPIRRALRSGSSATALWLAQRLIEADHRDLRLFALLPLRRALAPDPELTWQLLRRMGSRAHDWIEVDSLADLWARGILAEPFRWAELDALVLSQQPCERRLVGATLATIPHRVPRARRAELRGAASGRAFSLVSMLMGDAEPLVQKALAWAIREWSLVHPESAAQLLREEAALARATRDGSRAWVIREALARQPVELAAELRITLDGVRRHASATSTSVAAATAARFAPLLSIDPEIVARQGDRYARSRA
jgi:3-methyladenine DNA glycosylase AlkD